MMNEATVKSTAKAEETRESLFLYNLYCFFKHHTQKLKNLVEITSKLNVFFPEVCTHWLWYVLARSFNTTADVRDQTHVFT